MSSFPNEPSGSSPQVQWERRLLAACKSQRLKPGHGYLIKEKGDGIILEILGRSGSGTPIRAARVQSYVADDDYVEVKFSSYVDGVGWTDSGDAFEVALPPLLQQAVKPTTTHEDAEFLIWPTFEADDVVLIFRPSGGTGIEGSAETLLDYMLLPDQRSWCLEHRICLTSGDEMYAIMPTWTLADASHEDFNPVD